MGIKLKDAVVIFDEVGYTVEVPSLLIVVHASGLLCDFLSVFLSGFLFSTTVFGTAVSQL